MYFTLKMRFMTEISPKYCNIKAITCQNNDFQPFFCKIDRKNVYDKNFKYIQLSASLSLKFNTC